MYIRLFDTWQSQHAAAAAPGRGEKGNRGNLKRINATAGRGRQIERCMNSGGGTGGGKYLLRTYLLIAYNFSSSIGIHITITFSDYD